MMSALLLSTLIAVDLQGRFHGTLPMQGAGPDVVLRFEQVQSDILAWFTSMDMGRSEMPVPQVHTSDDGVHLNVLLGDSSLQLVATIDGDDVVLTNADTQATTRLARLAPLGPHVVWGGDLPAASGDLPQVDP